MEQKNVERTFEDQDLPYLALIASNLTLSATPTGEVNSTVKFDVCNYGGATAADVSQYKITVYSEGGDKVCESEIISLKVDQDTKMGIVSDVKQELREANALKINYSTKKGYDPTKR